ncbi:uncharacterized protein L201_001294 [Kwoniella dendrophila CBS 6074]|uniref:Uncharacterized protein n=1 Tax=Kwoniella dendrophila CBS 6074 TaxID=1295534 RepID=A0AAX4JLZ4_9TREE
MSSSREPSSTKNFIKYPIFKECSAGQSISSEQGSTNKKCFLKPFNTLDDYEEYEKGGSEYTSSFNPSFKLPCTINGETELVEVCSNPKHIRHIVGNDILKRHLNDEPEDTNSLNSFMTDLISSEGFQWPIPEPTTPTMIIPEMNKQTKQNLLNSKVLLKSFGRDLEKTSVVFIENNLKRSDLIVSEKQRYSEAVLDWAMNQSIPESIRSQVELFQPELTDEFRNLEENYRDESMWKRGVIYRLKGKGTEYTNTWLTPKQAHELIKDKTVAKAVRSTDYKETKGLLESGTSSNTDEEIQDTDEEDEEGPIGTLSRVTTFSYTGEED